MKETDLKGKIALITGASRGIGRTIALNLADLGMNLALISRSLRPLEDIKQMLKDKGTDVFTFEGDLSLADTPAQFVKQAVEYFGRLDIVINNAGIAVAKPLQQTTIQDWDYHMALNARAPFLICRESIEHLKRSDVGTIINISSVVGIKGYVNQAAYTASKHALMGMSKVLAKEIQQYGIRVHTICPGGVATDMVTKVRPDLDISQLISPQEIADVIIFLLKNRNKKAVIDDIHIRRDSKSPWF